MATETHVGNTMSSTSKDLPTILLVQGCFHTRLPYEALVNRLKALDLPTIHPQLPSCSNTDDPNFPNITLIDDALAIREKLIEEIEYEGKTVVVVMHAYGGLVGSEAIPEYLSYTERQSLNLPGGVIHLLYINGYILKEGESVLSAFGESPNNDLRPDGRFYIKDGENVLYNDLPAHEASLWASSLIPQSYKVQITKLTRAAWRYIPSTYIITEKDQAVPPQAQESFAATINADVERLDAGCCPMLSQPDKLAEMILMVAQKAVAKLTNE